MVYLPLVYDSPDKDGWTITQVSSSLAKAIMQYTGLKDKNGKKIHEGDILNIGEKGHVVPCEVVFWEGCFCIKPEWDKKGDPVPLKEYVNDVFINCVEHLGNIYENSELLKKK